MKGLGGRFVEGFAGTFVFGEQATAPEKVYETVGVLERFDRVLE